ncbi:MAG TPA: ATP-binding cassette domain-containing protein [Gemmatimonadales bacterium]
MHVSLSGLRIDRGGRRILDIATLDFPPGTVTAVFGPNGSGKTTLLRALAGLERSDGAVTIGGRPVSRGDRRVAIAFQEPVFVRGTVRANLALGLELRGVPARESDTRLASVAAACGIAGLLERSPRELSTGEAQRVNLARALALAAPVTLLDEPLSGFDRIGRSRMLEEVPALLAAHAATAVVVTHDREEAFRLARRLVLLIDGRVAAAGDAAVIYRAPPDAESARLLGYTVVPAAGRLVGFPPGALRHGQGPAQFELTVTREVDMGNHRHLVGVTDAEAGAIVAEIRLAEGEPAAAPGTRITVHPSRWVDFPVPGSRS